jgi:hypothetical protein
MVAYFNSPIGQLLGWRGQTAQSPGNYAAIAPMSANEQAQNQWAGSQFGRPISGWLPPTLSSLLTDQSGSWGGATGAYLPYQAGPSFNTFSPMSYVSPTPGQWGNNLYGDRAGALLGGFAPMSAGSTEAPPVDPGTQAVNDLTRVATSSAIQRLYEYLNANSATANQLEAVIPIVKEAADAYGQGNYSQAFIAVYQAFLSITMLRTQVPALPAL